MKFSQLALPVLIAVVLLFSFGCAQRPPESVVVEPPPVIQPSNNTTSAHCSTGNVLQKDECRLALAKTARDVNICRDIYQITKADDCYALFSDYGLEVCAKIFDSGLKSSCFEENARLANSSKSEEICNMIQDVERRFACLRKYVPPCTLVLDEGQRALCNALEKSDYTLCTNADCFSAYAQNRSDANACSLITSIPDRLTCVAVVNGNAMECKAASLSAVQDLCIEMSAEKLDDVNACSLATAGSDYRNRCYLHFAVKKQDSRICTRVEPEFSVGTGTSRNWCYDSYATANADVTVCPKILESLNRISCYYNAAAKNRMPSLCNPLGTESQRNDCYSKGIQNPQGPVPSDCQGVMEQAWKDKCYYWGAKATGNGTLCEYIGPGPDKDSCSDLFG